MAFAHEHGVCAALGKGSQARGTLTWTGLPPGFAHGEAWRGMRGAPGGVQHATLHTGSVDLCRPSR